MNTNEAISLIKQCLTDKPLKKITFSSPLDKQQNPYFKITAEPKQNSAGNMFFYQFSLYYETKIKHENFYNLDDAFEKISDSLNKGYKQTDIVLFGENIKILMNKTKNCKLIRSGNNETVPQSPEYHDLQKNYIFKENTPIPWLISLGVMDNSGRVTAKYQKKFRQLNKFIEIVDSVSEFIPDNGEIIDVGCGKSYLTFALYYYLNVIKSKNISITGLDLKQDVVANCQRLANIFGFDRLKFISADIKDYKHHSNHVDMVVTLHACDTATDYALYGAVKWGAKIILSVPCCQHELFAQIKNDAMNPLLKHGILKERFSALLTDALRAELLEAAGYRCNVIEFIDMEHTPKNIMIKAVRNQNIQKNKHFDSFLTMKQMFSAEPTLYKLLLNDGIINTSSFS